MKEFEGLIQRPSDFILFIVVPLIIIPILSSIFYYFKLKKKYRLTGLIDSRVKYSFCVLLSSQFLVICGTLIYIVLTFGFGLFDTPRIFAIDLLALPFTLFFSIYTHPYIKQFIIESSETKPPNNDLSGLSGPGNKTLIITIVFMLLLFAAFYLLNGSGYLRYFL